MKQPPKPTKPTKTNPRNETGNPWLHRHFAGVEWRCLVRQILHDKASGRLPELAERLASFAPCLVRGDYVPTIADSYAEALAIVNASPLPPSPAPTVAPVTIPIFTPDGRFRVEVRLVPA